MGYRVTTIDDLKKQNKELSSSNFKTFKNAMTMFYNLKLIADAPKYEDLISTRYTGASNISPIQEEEADELNTKQRKRGVTKLASVSRNRV